LTGESGPQGPPGDSINGYKFNDSGIQKENGLSRIYNFRSNKELLVILSNVLLSTLINIKIISNNDYLNAILFLSPGDITPLSISGTEIDNFKITTEENKFKFFYHSNSNKDKIVSLSVDGYTELDVEI